MTGAIPRFLDRSTPPHLATLILLSALSALAMNVFLPSLPNMTAYFQADYRLLQLSISAYLAVSAVLQLVIGPLSDMFGRRTIILWSVAVFVVATIGTLLAPNAYVFLAFRLLQAAIATGMALSRAIVRDMVDDSRAASMIAWLTLGMSIVPMLGPVVGGALDEVFGWKASFVLMGALGALLFVLLWADLGETIGRKPVSWAAQVRDYPELLASPRFWGYALCTAFASGVFFAYLGGAPFIGTAIYGLSPTWLGFFFGATGLGYSMGNFLSGRFSQRFGMVRMIGFGNLAMSVGLALQLTAYATGWGGAAGFFLPFLIVGVGNGLVLPNSQAGMLAVRPHLAGTASGLGGAIMIGGGAALSALAGALLTVESGAWPVIGIMAASMVGAFLSLRMVVRRNRQLGF